jgi:hypothetical protein
MAELKPARSGETPLVGVLNIPGDYGCARNWPRCAVLLPNVHAVIGYALLPPRQSAGVRGD